MADTIDITPSTDDYDLNNRYYMTTRCAYNIHKAALNDLVAAHLERKDHGHGCRDDLEHRPDLLEDPRYKSWRDGRKQFLNIVGKAGTGKSTLVAAAIRNLSSLSGITSGKCGLAFFIRSDFHLDHAEFVFLTLAAQIARTSEAAGKAIDSGWTAAQAIDEGVGWTNKWTKKHWIVLFSAAAKGFEKIYIVLDGLEENPDRYWLGKEAMDVFAEVAKKHPNFHILITSEQRIELYTNEDADDSFGTIELDGNDKEALSWRPRGFKSEVIMADERFKSLDQESYEKLIAMTSILGRLLAKLQLIIVHRRITSQGEGNIASAFVELPKSIDDAWRDLIETYIGDDGNYLRRMLIFMAYTYEPHGFDGTEPLGTGRTINLAELTDYVLTEPDDIKHDTETRCRGIDIRQWEDIFLSIRDIPVHDSPDSETAKLKVRKEWVSLIHPSLKRYVRSWIGTEEAHADITRVLMAYNCFEGFKDDFDDNETDEQQEQRHQQEGGYPEYERYPYRFRWYAAVHLTKHAKESNMQMEERWYEEFFSPQALKWKSVTKFCDRHLEGIAEMDRILHSTQLEMLVRDDVVEWIRHVVRDGVPRYIPFFNSSCEGGVCSLPPNISPISDVKSPEAFEVLINAPGIKLKGALSSAVWIGEEAVQKLLELGCDPNDSDGEALATACRRGDLAMVRFLVQHGADVNLMPSPKTARRSGGEALTSAVYGNHRDVILFLLEKGADMNSGAGHHCTPLFCAVEWGYKSTMELLLEKGADPNVVTPRGTALHIAAQKAASQGDARSKDILMTLLALGADPGVVGGRWGTALQAAIRSGVPIATPHMLEVVRALLGHPRGKHMVNTVAGKYHTAVAAAASLNAGGIEKVLELLRDNGADLDLPRGVPLLYSIHKGSLEAAIFLLESGVDSNGVVDPELAPQPYSGRFNPFDMNDGGEMVQTLKEFGTPLHLAAAKGRNDIVEALLKHEADKSKSGGYYGSAVDAAKRRRNKDILELLGVDVQDFDDTMEVETGDKDEEMANKMRAWVEPGPDHDLVVESELEDGFDDY